MFAYGIGGSRMRMALGVDAPLERYTGPVGLRPFAEYHAQIVTASPDPTFASYGGSRNRDQHWMTFGLRARVFQGLTLDAGVNVGLRSVGYEYGPPVPPCDLIFGLNYPFDTASFARPVVVTRTVEKAPEPSMGTVVGSVKNKSDGKPIAEAVVSFAGQPRARVATDPDGSFQSVPLPPGPAEITVAAAGFEPATGKANVVAGSASTIDVALVAKIVNGNVRGKVSDRAGRGLTATIRFNGPNTFEARADSTGEFSAILPAGPYRVTRGGDGLSGQGGSARAWRPGQDRQFDVTLRPANPDVTLTPQAIVLRVPIKFRAGAPKLPPAIKAELEAVADILVDHPEIKTLRIEAHWSGAKGGKAGDAAKKLTTEAGGGDQGVPGVQGRAGRPDRDGRRRGRGAAGPEPRARQPGEEPPGRAGRRPVAASQPSRPPAAGPGRTGSGVAIMEPCRRLNCLPSSPRCRRG